MMNDVVEFLIVFFSLLFTAVIDLYVGYYFSHRPMKKRRKYIWVWSKQFGTGQTLGALNCVKKGVMKMNEEYCGMCCDATVCPDLNDENDYSAFTLDCSKEYRLMMCSGWGRAPRLSVELLSELYKCWVTVLDYYPHYCPNCGRKIDKSYYRFFDN